METEYKHAIGIALFVLGLLLTFWTGAIYYALRDNTSTAALGVAVAIAVIGLVLLLRK